MDRRFSTVLRLIELIMQRLHEIAVKPVNIFQFIKGIHKNGNYVLYIYIQENLFQHSVSTI